MRPDSIRKFDMLYLGAVALGLINFGIGYETLTAQMNAEMAKTGLETPGSGILIGGMLLGVLISLALWFIVSRLRIEFVKWILVLFLVWGLITLAIGPSFTDGIGLIDAIALVIYAMHAAAIYFLFRPDAKAWFAEKRGPANPE